MCFAPQRRALYHLNFQKCSEAGVLCTLWLPNVLRATKACNFSSLISPDCSAPAALASLLFDPPEPQTIGTKTVFRDFATFSRTCIFFLLALSSDSFLWLFPLTLSSESFSSLIFSPLLSSALLCSALLFSSPLLSSPLFSSLLFSSLLWLFPPLLFPSYHIVGSLTSKLPSIICLQHIIIIIIIIILFWHIVTLWKSLQSHCKPARRFKKATPLSSPCAPGRFCCRPWVVGRDWRLVKPRWMNWTGLATCA